MSVNCFQFVLFVKFAWQHTNHRRVGGGANELAYDGGAGGGLFRLGRRLAVSLALLYIRHFRGVLVVGARKPEARTFVDVFFCCRSTGEVGWAGQKKIWESAKVPLAAVVKPGRR